MPERKNAKWVDDYKEDKSSTVKSDQPVSPDQPAANDADGWQQYRRWITKAPAPKGRRVGIDSNLYTWKGYRSWSEQVKRNWIADKDNDTDR